jgi:hypothetical protein
MTQEQKDLLLKDLCGRLPYGVKCAYFNTKDEIKVGELLTVWCKEKRVFIDKLSIDYDGGDCVGVIPYLFPLSSMTDEQKQEYIKVCELDTEILFKTHVDGTPFPAMYNSQDWLDSHHFDYRGLIPMGLANDATGKNIY